MFIFDITKDISTEILVIYGLIGLVVGLIFIIIYLDKKEKKRIDMTKTQELRLMDLRRADDDYIEQYKLVEKVIEDEKEEVVDEVMTTVVQTIDTINIDESMYVEDDLEKTSAQLRLEELTNELQKVQESQEYKISRFEAEQEENAIISYNELLKVSAQLYDRNDKVQYSDEGDEPITLDQLRSKFSSNSSNYNDSVEVL